jgi:N-acetylglutamate synthase
MPDVDASVAAGLPGWVGRRVVVRHRLPDGRATDALGTLESVVDDVLTVSRDRLSDGTPEAERVVRVRLSDVVLAKPVPPPPLSRGRARR